jgi:hypothetical protein
VPITLDGHSGVEMEIEAPDENRPGVMLGGIVRLYATPQRVFFLSAAGPKASWSRADAERFLGSFRLVPIVEAPGATPVPSARATITAATAATTAKPGGRTPDALGTIWEECETDQMNRTFCGTWRREGNGVTWIATWSGASVPVTIVLSDRTVRVTRRDPPADQRRPELALRATYTGTLSGDHVEGTVVFCCDALGERSGTWRATIR